MNTHDIDIELPAEFRSGNDVPVTSATIKRERMEEILRATIEADRKRRGEQRVIGRIKLDGNKHPRAELSTGYDENGDQWKEGTPIYAAPQPAEPSKNGPRKGDQIIIDGVVWTCTDPEIDRWVTTGSQPAEPRLNAPAQVGAARFGIGVKWSLVIRAAQRHYEYMREPEKEQERQEKFQTALKKIRVSAGIDEPVKVPSDADILFTMRHLERHLKCIDGAIPTLLSTARALLARYGRQPAEPGKAKSVTERWQDGDDSNMISRFDEPVKHDLYKTGDPDAPEQILDRNGVVVLQCCKRCGKAEAELSGPCETVKVPTKWSGWACQYPGKMPRLYGDKSIAMLNHHPEEGDRLLYLVEQSNPIPEPVKGPSDAEIREVFLANGFTIKPGHDDLKPYVYEAVRAVLARCGQPVT